MIKISEIEKPYTSTTSFKLFLFIYAILIICIKNTGLLAHPRFWAEEGKVYFKFAYEHGFWEALLAPHIDYYSLVPNLATCLGTLSIEKAPLITTCFALLCQLVPICIIIVGNFFYWNTPLKKIIFTLLIITAAEPEIWLNSINAQFFLGLATILIFFEVAFSPGKFKGIYGIILLFNGLNGPLTAFTLPLFLIKFYKFKNIAFGKYTLIVLLSSMLQVTLFIYAHLFKAHSAQRFGKYNFQLIAEGFFSHYFSLLKVVSVNDKKNIGIVMFIYFLYLIVVAVKNKDQIKLYLIAALTIVAVFSLAGAANMQSGSRYAYIPSVLLCIIIYSDVLVQQKNFNPWRYNFSLCILILTMTSYIFFYQYDRSHQFDSRYRWKDEVINWKKNSSLPLQVYPDKWEFYLKKRK